MSAPITGPKRAVILHKTLTWVWVLMLIPTLLWWRDSVFWVAAMSLYANVAGHWAAAEAAKGALEVRDLGDQSD